MLYAGRHANAVMNFFTLALYSADRMQRIDRIAAFTGADRSGSFGIRAGHARFMTILGFGLARFQGRDQDRQYLALPGGVLYFNRNELTISTRYYLIDTDAGRISSQLARQLAADEAGLRAARLSLQRLEQAFLTQLAKLDGNAGDVDDRI